MFRIFKYHIRHAHELLVSHINVQVLVLEGGEPARDDGKVCPLDHRLGVLMIVQISTIETKLSGKIQIMNRVSCTFGQQ